MGTLIRRGVFETNSSSSHTISLASEDKQFVMDSLYPDQDGVIHIHGGEYGWDWFKHNDALTKASYVAQALSNNDDALSNLREVIMEQTGATDVRFHGLENGYIDHDSYGLVENTNHFFREFIFNKNSWLFGGNDNERPLPDFYIVPEYKDNEVIHPIFTYELSVENHPNSAKFLTKPTDEELKETIYSLLSDAYITEDGQVIVDDSVHWQIMRPRNEYYVLDFNTHQNFETGEILLEKENTQLFFNIKKQMEADGRLSHSTDWEESAKLVTEELKKIPGALKSIKFTLKEI